MFNVKQLKKFVRCLAPMWRNNPSRPELRALCFNPPIAQNSPWRLTANTCDVSVHVEIFGCNGHKVALDGLELLTALPRDGRVSITDNGLRWAGGSVQLTSYRLDELPSKAISGYDRLVAEPGAELSLALRQVATAAAHENGRYAVDGIRVEGHTLIATDGRRLAVRRNSDDASRDRAVLISRPTAQMWARLSSFSKEVRWAIADNRILARGAGWYAAMRSISDDGYPPWRSIEKSIDASPVAATVVARDLKESLNDRRAWSVDLEATKDGLAIVMRDIDHIRFASKLVPAQADAPKSLGRFKLGFLRDIATAAGPRAELLLSSRGAKTAGEPGEHYPLIVSALAGVRHLLMPMA